MTVRTMVINKLIPLKYVSAEVVYILLGIKPTMGFDNDGKPTGEYVGYTLTLVDIGDFNQIKVKIQKVELAITPEELQEARENGQRVFVELEEGFIKPYFNNATKTIQDSITAKNFHIVQTNL